MQIASNQKSSPSITHHYKHLLLGGDSDRTPSVRGLPPALLLLVFGSRCGLFLGRSAVVHSERAGVLWALFGHLQPVVRQKLRDDRRGRGHSGHAGTSGERQGRGFEERVTVFVF